MSTNSKNKKNSQENNIFKDEKQTALVSSGDESSPDRN